MSISLWADTYRKLHTADFNGDGRTDLLLQNRLPQYHSSYLLKAQPSGSTVFYTKVCIDTLYGMSRELWAAENYNLYTGDFNGASYQHYDDVLLQSRDFAGPSYLLRSTGTGFYKMPVPLEL